MNKDLRRAALGSALAIVLAAAGCVAVKQAASAGPDDANRAALALMQRDFKARGQATMDRLEQDDVQAACTKYAEAGAVPPEAAKRIEAEQLATIKYPADGQLLGDWQAGEKIAQTGVGKQWSDQPTVPAGGNCYACHQLTKQELSYGTIGPSLLGYGKLRGNTPQIQRYTYGKIYNPEAFNACSSMPRFGHQGILTERQIKDVVALLLDPKSPVNQ